MTKKNIETLRIAMKKNTQVRRIRFSLTRNASKWTNVNKIGLNITEILVRSLDLVGNFQNVATLPSTYLCEFLELDRNKIYWDYLRDEISSFLAQTKRFRTLSTGSSVDEVGLFQLFSERPVPDPCAPPYHCRR